jgi:hypothetical protein
MPPRILPRLRSPILLRPRPSIGRAAHSDGVQTAPNPIGATSEGTAADPILIEGDVGNNVGHPLLAEENIVDIDNDLQILEGCGFETPPRT